MVCHFSVLNSPRLRTFEEMYILFHSKYEELMNDKHLLLTVKASTLCQKDPCEEAATIPQEAPARTIREHQGVGREFGGQLDWR